MIMCLEREFNLNYIILIKGNARYVYESRLWMEIIYKCVNTKIALVTGLSYVGLYSFHSWLSLQSRARLSFELRNKCQITRPSAGG